MGKHRFPADGRLRRSRMATSSLARMNGVRSRRWTSILRWYVRLIRAMFEIDQSTRVSPMIDDSIFTRRCKHSSCGLHCLILRLRGDDARREQCEGARALASPAGS